MLEKLYQNALDTSADIVICDYFINTNIAQKYIRQAPSVLDANTVLIEFFGICMVVVVINLLGVNFVRIYISQKISTFVKI